MVFLSICTALYDYTPQNENELAIEEGELIYVLEKSDEDDWWQAKKKAPSEDEEEPTGLIPNNYVEEARPTHQAKALYDYSRQTDEELSFSEDAILAVYDTSDPEWTLVGQGDEYGFAPANYIEITSEAEPRSPTSPMSGHVQLDDREKYGTSSPSAASRSGPAAAIAGIIHKPTRSSDPQPNLPSRPQQFTPEESEEDVPAPILPRRPESQQLSPPQTQHASPRSPSPPSILPSPPHNRVMSQRFNDEKEGQIGAGGYHLYNISEMVAAMGKSKKMPTTLGINLATGKIMIAPEKSRDGPQQEWTAEKLTHYSIEGKHVFMELIRPSKSADFHAGARDTAQEIVGALGELAGASRAEGLREVLEAAESGSGQRKGQVLYDFMAQGDDEVTVAVGDEVIVIDDTKSDDWWMVRRLKNGKEGVVPSSYVETIGIVAAPSRKAGANSSKSIVEQNRLEEERQVKEAIRLSKSDRTSSEVGSETKLPARGSSLSNDNNGASQRSKKDSKSHGRSSSSSKSKPDTTKLRTWTDRSASFKVEAQFIGLKDAKIHLHKLNGVKIAVPIAKMSVEDLEYVESVTGVSLDDEKPLSDIKRRSTQGTKGDDRTKSGGSAKAGASIDQSKQEKSSGKEYDWFDFFLKAGVSPYQCERYASNFHKDSMDENILSEITPTVLRTLGLKEGDILRVMKYLDNKFGRTGITSPEGASGGLFSGPGGTLRNNTSKGRPAPPIQTNDTVDSAAFRQRAEGDQANNQQVSDSSPTSSIPPPPPAKDRPGFDDDAWSVKPSKQVSNASNAPKPNPPAQPSAPQQPALTGSLLDLSLLSPPLQPTPAPQSQPQQAQQAHAQPQTQQSPPPVQPQSTTQQQNGANPSFFSQIGQPTNPATNFQSNLQPQQTGPPRQRPLAPPQTGQPGAIMPPPPAPPLSAPQTQQQTSNFGPPPLQPQLTGYQPQSLISGQVAPPGQSLNDLNQQRFQQQQFNQQQQFLHQQQQQQQQLQPQQTGFGPQAQNFGQFTGGLQPRSTGFQQPAFQNPYVIGQQQGSPFADPRGPKPQFQPSLQPQNTRFQPQFTGFTSSYQPSPAPLQPTQTGVNSMLPPALQPQNTAVVNGFSRPSFSQETSVPPVPPIPQMPAATPLQPQKTGPAPPVRFGTQPASKLVPQATGRKANLSAATPSNPFGF